MKKTNKGFSLVELIIVIAIMAILAGAIAPALIRYIDKSRRSNDVTSAKTIKTAVETALGTEDCYSILTSAKTGDFILLRVDAGKKYSGTAAAASNGSLAGAKSNGDGVVYVKGQDKVPDDVDMTGTDCLDLIAKNIGEKTPKMKYKKVADSTVLASKPDCWYIMISDKGTVYIAIGAAATTPSIDSSNSVKDAYEIQPNINKAYQ